MKVKKVVEEEIYVAPCIKCRSNDIEISDYGYSSFNIAYAKCLNCGNEHTLNCGCFPPVKNTLKLWNDNNDIQSVIKNIENLISENRKQIKLYKERIEELKTKS